MTRPVQAALYCIHVSKVVQPRKECVTHSACRGILGARQAACMLSHSLFVAAEKQIWRDFYAALAEAATLCGTRPRLRLRSASRTVALSPGPGIAHAVVCCAASTAFRQR